VAAAARWLGLALLGAQCVYWELPIRTPLPGLASFTLSKLLLLLFAGASLPALANEGARRAALRPLLPLFVLTAWVLGAALVRPAFGWQDAKLFAGLGVAAVAAAGFAVSGRDVRMRRGAVLVLLAGGALAAVAALAEPALTPSADGLWAWFRAGDPEDATRHLHWIDAGTFRISGVLSDPNELSNLLGVWLPLVAASLAAALGNRAGLLAALGLGCLALAGTMTRSSLLATAAGAAGTMVLLTSGPVARAGIRRALNGVPARAALAAAAGGAVLLAWLVATNRATAATAGAVLALTVAALTAAGSRWLRQAEPRDAFVRSAVRWTGVTAIAVVLTGLGVAKMQIFAHPGPPPAAHGAAAPAVPDRWVPETRIPSNPAERLEETALHAGWERTKLWRVAVWMLRDAPLGGPGYGAFFDVIQHDDSLKIRFDLDRRRGDISAAVDNPHNLYLTAALAGGLPALGLLLWTLATLARTALAVARSARWPAGDRALACALVWVWLGFAAKGLVGQNIFPVDAAAGFCCWAGLTASVGARNAAR